MVSGEQLEDMVSQHPAVVESAVVAVPSDLGEDDIKLCVVPMPGNTLEPADIIEWLTKRVPRHLVPRFIEIRASLPKTDMGKIQRAALRSEGSRGLTARTWDQERETFVGEQS